MDKIDNFSGEYRFFSNFWPSVVILDGEEYPSVEHAYQAAKTFDLSIRKKIRENNNPNSAKQAGKSLPLRSDWEKVKLGIMEDLLIQKFKIPELVKALLDTGTAELIEGNWWGDKFWGVCRGQGKNHLGKLLMKIRAALTARV